MDTTTIKSLMSSGYITKKKKPYCQALILHIYSKIQYLRRYISEDFPGGRVDKGSPAKAGHVGLIPDVGRFHMLQGS